MSSFTGFPKEALHFFNELILNNNKLWFDQHKPQYEKQVLEPARNFIIDMGNQLRTIIPKINADPRVNQSLFRINRDIRFSKDKSPYKTHLAIWFWEGEDKRMECPGFYFHFEPQKLFLGSGIHQFSPDRLKQYRQAVLNEESGSSLSLLIKEFESNGIYSIGDKKYKKVPRGFDGDNKNAPLLLYSGLSTYIELDISLLQSPDLISQCFTHFKAMLPLHCWLMNLINGEWQQ